MYTEEQWSGLAITANTFLTLSGHAKLKIVVSSSGRSKVNLESTATLEIKLHILSPLSLSLSMLNVEVFKPLQAYQAKLALHLYQGFKL
jgi:hypothetical protein